MFNIGDIVRIVNSNGEYGITIDGTVGEIMSLPAHGEQHFKVMSLPTSRNRSYIGEVFYIKINYMELVAAKEIVPYEHVINKIKVMETRFTTRKVTQEKQKYTHRSFIIIDDITSAV